MPIQPTPPTRSTFDHPIFFIPKVALSPPILLIKKVKNVFEHCIGYLATIGVFSFGSYNTSLIKRQIINLYNFITGTRTPFDRERLSRAIKILEGIGGIRSTTISKDGTKLDTMLLRHNRMKEIFQQNGWSIQEKDIQVSTIKGEEQFQETSDPTEKIDFLIPDKTNPKWEKFNQEYLSNLGLKKTIITLENGESPDCYLVNRWNYGNQRPPEGLTSVRCNSPAESAAMSKRDILRRLLLGFDVLLFNPPGTPDSEGIPSEGGYYLATETMVEKALHEYGIPPEKLWVEGFCLGGANAIHAKKKFHELGINLFTQNTFDNMGNTFLQQIWPANWIAYWLGLNSVQSRDPRITRKVRQDCFHSVDKLNSLKTKNGNTIMVFTDSDQTIHPHSASRLAKAAKKASKTCHYHIFKHPDKRKNGHTHDILGERKVWEQTIAWIAECYPKESKIVQKNPVSNNRIPC